MSGLSCLASLTASAPSHASPITLRSGSVSKRRRKPSRKIGWSSAIRMRVGCGRRLSIGCLPALRDSDFQT